MLISAKCDLLEAGFWCSFGLSSLVRSGIDRQGELKCCARAGIRGGPQTSAVRFDNRPANRQSHTSASRFGGIERIEDLPRLFWQQSYPSIGNRDQQLTILGLLRPDCTDQRHR